MFFTRLGTVAAWLIFVFAALRIGTALYIMLFIHDAEMAAIRSAKFLFFKTPEEAISQALPYLGLAIAMGILAEISQAVRRSN